MHPIAKAHVVELHEFSGEVHDAAPRAAPAADCSANISAVRVAADVMMSRFPA
jgi:hypothetical protein